MYRSNRRGKAGPLHDSNKEDVGDLWRAPQAPQHPNSGQIHVMEEKRKGEAGILIVYAAARLNAQEDQAEKQMRANEERGESEHGSCHSSSSRKDRPHVTCQRWW